MIPRLVILAGILWLAGCHAERPAPAAAPCPVIDTALVMAPLDAARAAGDSLARELAQTRIQLQAAIARGDSLGDELFLARMTVEKVRFYVKLVLQKPSQRKFLLGWVRRAVGL